MSKTGFIVDTTNCIGCRTCVVACKDANQFLLGCGFREVATFDGGEYPNVFMYSVSYVPAEGKVAPKTGEVRNCDFCARLQKLGEPPACVAACPMRVIEFGDVDELVKPYIEQGMNVISDFPAAKKIGPMQANSTFVIKDCMKETDVDKIAF